MAHLTAEKKLIEGHHRPIVKYLVQRRVVVRQHRHKRPRRRRIDFLHRGDHPLQRRMIRVQHPGLGQTIAQLHPRRHHLVAIQIPRQKQIPVLAHPPPKLVAITDRVIRPPEPADLFHIDKIAAICKLRYRFRCHTPSFPAAKLFPTLITDKLFTTRITD